MSKPLSYIAVILCTIVIKVTYSTGAHAEERPTDLELRTAYCTGFKTEIGEQISASPTFDGETKSRLREIAYSASTKTRFESYLLLRGWFSGERDVTPLMLAKESGKADGRALLQATVDQAKKCKTSRENERSCMEKTMRENKNSVLWAKTQACKNLEKELPI